jgi:hypothetical protein
MFRERVARHAVGIACLGAAILGAPSVGWGASAEDRATARKLGNQAQELKKKGKIAEACKQLEQVERLDPKLPTLMELAECTEQLGRLVEAQAYWSRARDRAKHDEKPQSRARAEARLAAVQKRVAHLTLQLAAGTPNGAQVLIDEVAVDPGVLAAALPMNPGEHSVTVRLLGREDAKHAVKLAEGDSQSLAIAAGPVAASQATPALVTLPPASPPPSPTASTPSPTVKAAAAVAKPDAPATGGWWSTEHKAGLILGGVGVVGIGAGSALIASANGDGAPSVDARWAWGGVSIATGGVLLLSGIVLLASSSSAEASPQGRLFVSPTLDVGQGTAKLGAAGRF